MHAVYNAERYKCEIEFKEILHEKEVRDLKNELKKLKEENESLKLEIEKVKSKDCDSLPKKRKT